MTAGEIDSQILAQLEAVYPVSRETIDRLGTYQALLNKWQAKTNLVARGTLDQFWLRHVADSLQLAALKPDARRWTDLGSGGGFPGMVLAIVLAEGGGQGQVHLVESIQKKCAFLRQVAHGTEARATIHCKRIESATEQLADCAVITARALAPLPRLLDWTGDHIRDGRVALFPKGRDYLREIEDCRGRWRFDLLEHPGRIDATACILEIANVERIG
ncbi:MAG: 16S rRNA (guanine(527)-N(7))-methyltransferase RsmG [Nitratireductor sp.]|nr:16S rRNA (guanine(527)-N(7))-methyltransferase RsmG [Nitratireductor sp.]